MSQNTAAVTTASGLAGNRIVCPNITEQETQSLQLLLSTVKLQSMT